MAMFPSSPYGDWRQVLCIGGPWNGRVISVDRHVFKVPIRPSAYAPMLGECSLPCESVLYQVEPIANLGENMYIARSQEIDRRMCMHLLFEAFAAWHSSGRRDRRAVAERPSIRDPIRDIEIRIDPHRLLGDLGVDFEEVAREIAHENEVLEQLGIRKPAVLGLPIEAPVVARLALDAPQVDADAPCDDCKSTRLYQPLIGPPIACPTCRPAQ